MGKKNVLKFPSKAPTTFAVGIEPDEEDAVALDAYTVHCRLFLKLDRAMRGRDAPSAEKVLEIMGAISAGIMFLDEDDGRTYIHLYKEHAEFLSDQDVGDAIVYGMTNGESEQETQEEGEDHAG